MTPVQNESTQATDICNPAICQTAIPKVRAQDSHLIWRTGAKVFETHALSLFCAREVNTL
jgi:hypothetical protein